MRVITNRGVSLFGVGDKVFPIGSPVLVSDEWLRENGTLFPPSIENREATIRDVYPTNITYPDRLNASDITAVTVNFRTLALIRLAVETFRWCYPTVPLVVCDNGSGDDSTRYISGLPVTDQNMRVILLSKNEGHGPPLHRMIMEAGTPFVFTFDSDVMFKRKGFLERMKTRLVDQGLYAIGPIWHRDVAQGLYYCSAVAALFRVEMYKKLPPFVHAPDIAVDNMVAARERGCQVEDFPVFDYLDHLEAGTRSAYRMQWDLTSE